MIYKLTCLSELACAPERKTLFFEAFGMQNRCWRIRGFNLWKALLDGVLSGIGLEPASGFEPLACSLRVSYSTN